jgi:hypothetical protein
LNGLCTGSAGCSSIHREEIMKKLDYKKRSLITYVKIKCKELPVVILNEKMKKIMLYKIEQEFSF